MSSLVDKDDSAEALVEWFKGCGGELHAARPDRMADGGGWRLVAAADGLAAGAALLSVCLLYTSPSPRDRG